MRMQDNGHWTGQRFTDAQVRALQALPDDVLSPRLKESIAQLNALAGQPGRQIVIDYNAALKGRKYSSGISPTTRIAVPITLDISKAGNFLMTTLDVSHFMRKLGDWQTSKPRAFDAWGGDLNGFMRDTMKYLDNHQRGLPGATDLDADARTAIVKRNVIKDLFNVGGPGALSETGGAPISSKTEKDNLIRSRRFDRINRITPGEGTPFPIDYYKQKANLLPPDVSKLPATHPAEVARVTKDQAVLDFARTLDLPLNTARSLGEHAWQQLERTIPRKSSAIENAATLGTLLRSMRNPEAITSAAMQGGLDAARVEVGRQAKLTTLTQ